MIYKRIIGIVERNLGRGSKLGFPTANLQIPNSLQIETGVYTALTKLGGQTYKSLAFVGAAETFGENKKKIEIFILDFNRDIYGRKIAVQFLERLRENTKFDSAAELVAQMKRDERQARQFFKTFGRTE